MPRYSGIYHQRLDRATRDRFAFVSLALNAVLLFRLLFPIRVGPDRTTPSPAAAAGLGREALTWNGGHPTDRRSGSCYCGAADGYCLCTPNVAIDLVVASGRDHLWLVRRRDTGQLATVGGFVLVGEAAERAVARELQEETGIVLRDPPVLLGLYSDPRRDNRRHTASAVYLVRLDGAEQPRAADDVKDVQRIHLDDIEKFDYFADHRTILLDYRSLVRNEPLSEASAGDFAGDIVRSVCSSGAIASTRFMSYS